MRAQDGTGRNILPRTRKTRALLAILALSRGAPVLRLTLTSLLWSEREPEQARGSLRQCLHELQEQLHGCVPDLLVAERAYLVLRAGAFVMDVPSLDADCPPWALDLLDDGAFSAGGEALLEDLAGLDDAFTEWLAGQRRLFVERLTATARAALEAVPARQAELIVARAERLLRLSPGHEPAWRALMSAHAALGDQDEAARAFERCAAALGRARLGPASAETRNLAERIRHADMQVAAPAPERMPERMPDQMPDRGMIRLGVMAFRPLGATGENADEVALCAGLAEEITTAMARFRGIFLIASSSLSALAARGRTADWAALRQELRLDFVLDGTVQRSAGQIRVMVRLLDLRVAEPDIVGNAGEVVWSRRFDRPAIDLLALQDEIASATVAQVDPELMKRAARPPGIDPASADPASAGAHELLLRAIPSLYRLEESSFRAAGDVLATAMERGPNLAPVHAWFAYWHLVLAGQGWAADAPAAMESARKLADRAVLIDPTDARALAIAGHARAFDRCSIDEALALHERALELNPNLPLAWALAGLCQCYAGGHELAARRIEQARKLSPFDPHGFFFDMALSLPLLMLGRHAESVAASRRAATMNPMLSSSYKGYLAALGYLTDTGRGHMHDVRGHLERLEPDFTLATARARSPLRRIADVDIYIEGLRRGGLRAV